MKSKMVILNPRQPFNISCCSPKPKYIGLRLNSVVSKYKHLINVLSYLVDTKQRDTTWSGGLRGVVCGGVTEPPGWRWEAAAESSAISSSVLLPSYPLIFQNTAFLLPARLPASPGSFEGLQQLCLRLRSWRTTKWALIRQLPALAITRPIFVCF